MNKSVFVPFFLLATASFAEVRLPSFFSSGMVLQRNMEVAIWGWADPGEMVTLSLEGNKTSTRATDEGTWSIAIWNHPPGGPFDITITGKNKIVLENVLFGDVWICSGQSNMEWAMAGDYNGEKEAAVADYPQIRLFKVRKEQSQYPEPDVEGWWQECSPSSVRTFSAVAYYFGKEIHLSQNVPVGLIQAAWGGSGIVSWMSADAYDQLPRFSDEIQLLRSDADYLKIKSREYHEEKLNPWFETIAKNSDLMATGSKLDKAAMWRTKWTDTVVPKVWERTPVGDYNGLVWYKTSFNANERLFTDEKTFLSLGKLDDQDLVFLNGQRIGHGGWKEWDRFYAIPDSLLKEEENQLIVGIIDYGGPGGFAGEANDLFIDSFDKSGTNVRYPLPIQWAFYVEDYHPEVQPAWLGGIVEPTILFNAMLAPLTRFPVKGAIWYQGEHSKGNPEGYDELLKALIRDWRSQWGQEELPFLFVQLPNYANEPGQYPEGNWALLRHHQAQALELPNTGMAVTYDVGNPYDIHPLHKEPVGHRLALAARKVAYGEQIVYTGPQLKEVVRTKDHIRLKFDIGGQQLTAHDPYGYVRGFRLGFQKKGGLETIPVQAMIEGDDIIIKLRDLGSPDLVRYAWEDNPDANLYNESGLPAPPFEYTFN